MLPSGILVAQHTRAAAALVAAGLIVVGSPGVGVANATKYPGPGGKSDLNQQAPYANALGGAALPEVWPDPILAGNGPDVLLSGYVNNMVGIAAGPTRGGQNTWAGGGSGAQLATPSASFPFGPSAPILMPGEGSPGGTAAVIGGDMPASQGGSSADRTGTTAAVVGGDMPGPQDLQLTSAVEPTNPIIPVGAP
jgi:hypothetical protein